MFLCSAQIDDAVFKNFLRVDLSATQMAEKDVAKRATKEKVVLNNLNKKRDDVLPTGAGAGAMTALVTHVRLDPNASRLQLVLTYRSRQEVADVLRHAEQVRDRARSPEAANQADAAQDTSTEASPDVSSAATMDDSVLAFFACALLGLRSDDEDDEMLEAHDLLERHTGVFALPTRFDALYGTERRLSLCAVDTARLLSELREVLLVHTIGDWSHWPVVARVELVVPSRLDHPLRICDVPGFGDDKLDPFRQSLVDAALKLECSTLLVCLKTDRLTADAQETAHRLAKLGIFEDLFGEPHLRRVGKLSTITALDWALAETLQNALDEKRDVQHVIKDSYKQSAGDSRKFLYSKLHDGMKARVNPIGGEAKKRLKARVELVMKDHTQQFAIDVRGTLASAILSSFSNAAASSAASSPSALPAAGGAPENPPPWRMAALVDSLLDNNIKNVEHHQTRCLKEFVSGVLLPFYNCLDGLGDLKNLEPEADLKMFSQKNLLALLKNAMHNLLSQAVMIQQKDNLWKKVVNPKLQVSCYKLSLHYFSIHHSTNRHTILVYAYRNIGYNTSPKSYI